jgi:hypothetical protein
VIMHMRRTLLPATCCDHEGAVIIKLAVIVQCAVIMWIFEHEAVLAGSMQ